MCTPSASARDFFLAAVEKTDPRDRAVFLGQACGDDPDLKRRVEALPKVRDQPDQQRLFFAPEQGEYAMCKNWFRLRVGLMTLVALSVALVLSLSVANAGKTPAAPVKYTMTTALSAIDLSGTGFPLSDRCTIHGMNNNGDVLAVVGADEGMRVVVWQSASHTYYDVPDLILHGQNLVKAVSPELARVLKSDYSNWASVVNVWFGEHYGHKINDSGKIVGSFWFINSDGFQTWHAFRYTPAVLDSALNVVVPAEFIDLGVPEWYDGSMALAINNNGDVVGYANGYDLTDRQTAYLWTNIGIINGSPSAAPHPCVPASWATNSIGNHLNEAGQVTGSMDLGGSGGHGAHAFRFDVQTGDTIPLGVLRSGPGEGSGGGAINDLGQVAGSSFATSTGNQHAYRYTYGVGMVDLGTLASPTLASSSWDINNKRHVVGWSDTSSRTRSVFLYTDTTGMLDLAKLIYANTLPEGATTSNIAIVSHVSDDYVDPLALDYQYKFGQICGYISVNGMMVPFILTPDR